MVTSQGQRGLVGLQTKGVHALQGHGAAAEPGGPRSWGPSTRPLQRVSGGDSPAAAAWGSSATARSQAETSWEGCPQLRGLCCPPPRAPGSEAAQTGPPPAPNPESQQELQHPLGAAALPAPRSPALRPTTPLTHPTRHPSGHEAPGPCRASVLPPGTILGRASRCRGAARGTATQGRATITAY